MHVIAGNWWMALRKAVEANTESIKDMSTSLQRLEVAIGRLKGK